MERSQTYALADNAERSRTREILLFLSLAVPTVLTNLARSALGMTDISILGHYKSTENVTETSPSPSSLSSPYSTQYHPKSTQYVAAAGYTITWFTIVGVIFQQGLAAAVSVLGAQAFGSGNIRLLGYYLQIGLSTSTVGALLVSGVSFFAGQFMRVLIGFDEAMFDLVTSFSRVTIIGFFPLAWCTVLNAWLMAQKIVRPQLWTYTLCVGINILLNLVLIYGVPGTTFGGFGFIGSAIATATSRWIQFIFLAVLSSRMLKQKQRRKLAEAESTRINRKMEGSHYEPFLGSESMVADSHVERNFFQNEMAPTNVSAFHWDLRNAHTGARMRSFFKQAAPMAMTGLLEDGQLQLISVLAGRFGTVAAAAHQGMFNVFWVLSSLMWAVSAGNRVRVANYLGAGDVEGAKFALGTSSMLGLPTAAVVSISLYLARDSIGFVFSEDPEVDHLTAQIMTLVGIAYFALGFFYLSMSTLNAAGKPLSVAVAFVCGAWFVCVPLAFFFRANSSARVFGVHLDSLFGLWLAMSVGYGITTLIAVVFVIRTDWQLAAETAVKNAEMKQEQASSEPCP